MKAEAKTFLGVMFVFSACLAKTETTDAPTEIKRSSFPAAFGCSSNAPAAELEALRSEFEKLVPFLNETKSDSFLSEAGNADYADPRPLSTRLVSFATSAPENPFGWVRNGHGTIGIMQGPRLSWERKYSDEQVETGRARNALARFVFVEKAMTALPSANPEIQKAIFNAAMDIWLSADDFADEEAAANRRRAEDGIPSAAALLEWFAENDSFCESVRAEARARLGKIKKDPVQKTDVGLGGEIAAEEPKQEVRPVPEEAFPATGAGNEKGDESP